MVATNIDWGVKTSSSPTLFFLIGTVDVSFQWLKSCSCSPRSAHLVPTPKNISGFRAHFLFMQHTECPPTRLWTMDSAQSINFVMMSQMFHLLFLVNGKFSKPPWKLPVESYLSLFAVRSVMSVCFTDVSFFNDVVLGKMLFSPEGIFLLQVATWQNWKQGWWAAPCPHYTLYIHDWQAPPSLTTVHLYTCRLEFDFSVCQTVFACFLMSLMHVDKPLTLLLSFNIGWTLLYTNHLSNTSQGEKVQIWLSPKIGCHTCTHTDAHAQS